MKRTFLRVVSMCLAMILFACSFNLSVIAAGLGNGSNTTTLQSTVSTKVKSGSVEKTDGQLVAEMYSDVLSELEKNNLSETALVGKTYTFTKPTDDLVTIIPEQKKVTADTCTIATGEEWKPDQVKVYVNGQLQKTIPYKVGGVTFEDITANSYYVEVDYKLDVDIKEALQRKLLNAPAALAGAVVNLNIIRALQTNLNSVAENIGTLYQLTTEHGGITLPGGGGFMFDAEDPESKKIDTAVTELYHDANKAENNLKTFDLCRKISTYDQGVAITYIKDHGAELVELFNATHAHIKTISTSTELDFLLRTMSRFPSMEADRAKLEAARSLIRDINSTMSTVDAACWTVVTDSPVKSDATSAEIAALNTAVLAAVDGTSVKTGVSFHNDVSISSSYTAATHTITKGVSQYKVNVEVVADVYQSGATVTTRIPGARKLFVLDENADAAAIRAAIDDSGVIAEAVATWDPFYGIDAVGTHYTIAYENIPASLTEDVTCKVVFTPKQYTVSYDYQGSEPYGYGYTLTLPMHADLAKSYVYTVNGQPIYQGNTVRVTGDISITRKEGKSVVEETLPAFVAGSANPGASLTEKDKNILKAGGLLFGTIALSKPETADALVEVEQTTPGVFKYEVTAQNYTTAVLVNGVAKSGTWVPAKVLVAGTQVATFTGNTAEFTHDSTVNAVHVVYTLTIDTADVSVDTVKELAKLPAVLAAEAAAQSSKLNAAAELYDSSDFQKANNLVSVLVSTLTDPANASKYKPETIAAARKLGNDCLNADRKLLLADTLKPYFDLKESGGRLAYYYSGDNSKKLNAQIADLAEVFTALADDQAFLEWADSMQSGASDLFTEYKDKIADIAVPAVNAKIDRNADMPTLTSLASALLASGTTSGAEADGRLTHETTVEGTAANLAMITVTVSAGGNKATGSLTYPRDAIIDADILADIEALIQAKKAEIEGMIAEEYYQATDVTLPTIGEAVTAYPGFHITYTPKEYKVTLAGEPDMTFTYNTSGMFINLPRPIVVGGVYRYTICGTTLDVKYEAGSASQPYQITEAHLNTYFDATGTMAISRVTVDTTRENFLKFVDSLNAAFLAGNVDAKMIVASDPDDYSVVLRVGPGMTNIQAEAMLNDLMDALASYGEIKLAGSTFYSGVSVRVQAIVDMVASSGFSFDTVYNIIGEDGSVRNDAFLQAMTSVNSVGGKIAETEMALDDLPVKLYITVYGQADALASAKKALGTVKNYVNVSCNGGVYNLSINMPEKVYPYYMSAMLLLDQTSFSGVQTNISVGDTMRYYKSLVNGLVSDPNFTVETLENTLADFNRTVDLSAYEKNFNAARKVIKYLLANTEVTNEVSDHEHFSATVTVPTEDAFNHLPAKYAKLKQFFAEAQAGGKLSANVNVTMTDRATDYDAMIFDNSKSGINKFYYTTDLTTALSGLGNNSVVVLLSDADLTADVTIPNNAFINLNGFTLNGNLNTAATVTISDSTLHTTGAGVGAVNGTLSGTFKITGGKFSGDVTTMLPKGYAQDADGYVANIYYTFEEDAAGNIDVNIPADILATRTLPELRSLAVEIAMDLAFNAYNAASLTVDGRGLYSFTTNDLLGLASKPGSEIVNTLIGKVDMDNVRALANSIFAEMTNFEAIAAKLGDTTGNPESVLFDYDMTTNGWAIALNITADNRIGVDIVAGAQKDRTLTVSVDGSAADKAALANLFTEAGKTLNVVASLDELDVNYNGGLKVTYSGAIHADVNFAHNNDYAALMAAAVASATGNTALKDALKTYLTNGATIALAEQMENITLAQFISGLQHLKEVGFDAVMTNLGLSSQKLADLEALYGDLVYIAGTILTRLDITGGTQILATHKVPGSFASYQFGPKTVRHIDLSLSITMMTKKEGTVTPPISPEDPVTPILPPTNPTNPPRPSTPIVGEPVFIDNVLESILSYKVETVDGVQHIYLDANVNGITKNQLIGCLKISATNAPNGTVIDVTNTVVRDGKEYIKTGSVLTITASNGSTVVRKSFVLVIDGDVNCDGMVTSADAVTLAWHYCGTATIRDKAALLAADVDGNAEITSADAIRIVLKYMYWKNGDSRYVPKFGS